MKSGPAIRVARSRARSLRNVLVPEHSSDHEATLKAAHRHGRAYYIAKLADDARGDPEQVAKGSGG